MDWGQGVAHCICDAASLVDVLEQLQTANSRKPTDLYKTISAYDAELVKRGAEEGGLSVQSMNILHDWVTLMEAPAIKIGNAGQNSRYLKSENIGYKRREFHQRLN
jgi:hypothetical protein